MFTATYRLSGFPVHEIWFATRVNWLHMLGICIYNNFLGKVPRQKSIMIYHRNYTLVSDLYQNEDSLLEKMRSTTRNEIRRASHLGMAFGQMNRPEFVEFYNAFAIIRGLTSMDPKSLSRYSDSALVCTKASDGAGVLAAHAYLCDYRDKKGVLLRFSARAMDGTHDNLTRVGYANRALHWHDMTLFKSCGYAFYDWGGYTKGEPTLGRNEFKLSFGGTLCERHHFSSPLMYLLKRCKMFMKSAPTQRLVDKASSLQKT